MASNPYQAPAATSEPNAHPPVYQTASSWKRLLNYLIDTVVVFVALSILAAVFGLFVSDSDATGTGTSSESLFTLLFLGLVALYFIIMEACFGRTVGKFATRTLVVNERDKKPHLGQIIGRTFSRLIPFDWVSYIGKTPRGFHDSIPKTKVVDTSKPLQMSYPDSPTADIFSPQIGAPIPLTPVPRND